MPYTPTDVTAKDVQHGDGHVGQLQRGSVAEDRHLRPNGITANAMTAGITEMTGARRYIGLSTPAGMMAFLEHQLDAVGEALQHAERADPVRAEPHLHPAQHLALDQDGHQHGEQQEHEDRDRLDHDQPPRVVAECVRSFTVVLRRIARWRPGWFVAVGAWRSRASSCGSQTTRSGISVISRGSVIDPCSVLTVTGSPWVAPISAAVAGDSRGDGRAGGAGQVRFAVLQAAGVEQHAPAGQDRLAGAGLAVRCGGFWVAGWAAGPSQTPRRASSSRAAAGSGRPKSHAHFVGDACAAPA